MNLSQPIVIRLSGCINVDVEFKLKENVRIFYHLLTSFFCFRNTLKTMITLTYFMAQFQVLD